MRRDMFSSAITGLAGHNSKTACDTWTPQVGQGQFVQENAFRFSGIVRRIVTQEPKDALRKGFSVKGLSTEDQSNLDAFNERREFLPKFQSLREWARKYAAAAILMDVEDGRDWSEPIDFQNIRRLGQLTVLDRYELEVRGYEHDLTKGQMYSPKSYILVSDNQREVHPSRLIVMQGIKLTPREQMQNNGVGESVINATWKSLRDYLTTHSYIAEAVTRLTQGVLKMPALEGSMTGCDAKAVEDRMQMLSFWMSALGDIALTGDESYEVHNRSMAGLPDVARLYFQNLVVETDIPMTILGGQTPGGLNTGANVGEWQSWTSHLGGEQTRTYNPAIRQYLDVAFRAGNSPVRDVPEMWAIDWPELFEPNMVEFSNSVAQTANAGVLLESAGMYTRSEIRNNALLAKAFPHDEGIELESELREPVGEPEEEELSVDDEE